MPAISDIVINDGAADVTFSVKTTDGRVATFLDRSAGVPLGYGQLTIGVTEPNDTKAPLKHTTNFRIPEVSSVDGSMQVARLNSYKQEFFWSQSSTLADRQALFNLVKDLYNDANYEQSVINNSPYY